MKNWPKVWRYSNKALAIVTLIVLCSCGSDSGNGARGDQELRVVSPENDVEVSAGQMIQYELMLANFQFEVPFDRRSKLRDELRHEEESQEMSHTSVDDEESTHMHSDDEDSTHAHSDDETNPGAREGHYHIYWDNAVGTDTHVTAWTNVGEYMIPSDASLGTHTLRFELRDSHHTLVGTPGSEAVLFLQVK